MVEYAYCQRGKVGETLTGLLATSAGYCCRKAATQAAHDANKLSAAHTTDGVVLDINQINMYALIQQIGGSLRSYVPVYQLPVLGPSPQTYEAHN